jgi:hypothetical protein
MATQKIAMGINLRQNKIIGSSAYGKYYPEVDTQKTLSLRGFAKHMTDHGSLYGRAIVEGVLMQITECLPELVAQGVPVQLGNLGTFYPTAEVAKDAAVLDIPQMDGLNPNDIVKAIHIRFLPDATKLDNLCGPKFKDACTLELRNIIDTQKVMVNGKQKVVTTLKPIATAVAEWKAQNGQSGSSAGSETGQGGSSSQGGQSQGGSSTGSETAEGYALTISTSGSGSASVTKGGNAVTSGANLNEDDEVEISITPAEGETPTATINGSSIELTESEGVYSGSFAMPGQASSLVINTGGSSGGNGGADLDKD